MPKKRTFYSEEERKAQHFQPFLIRFPKKMLSTKPHSFSRNRSPKPSQIRSQTPVVSGRNIFKLFRISKTRQNLSNRCLFRMQDKASPPNWW